MQIGPFITLVSSTFGVPERSVTQVARALREAGWLTTGARGVNAPDMSARDAARLSLALLTGEPPSRVVDEFAFVRTLETIADYPKVGLLTRQALSRFHTFEDAVTELFEFSLDPARILRQSSIFMQHPLTPEFSVSFDTSRSIGTLNTPEMPVAVYIDMKGEAELAELRNALPMSPEARERIREIQRGRFSVYPAHVDPRRGMRVVRTITEEEILAIGEQMRPPK